MNKELISLLKKALQPLIKTKEGDIPLFYKKNYDPIKLSSSNFHEIKTKINENDKDKYENRINNKLCFIDGGSQEIIKAPNFSLQLIRIYRTIYKNNKRIDSAKKEFFCLASTLDKSGKLVYKVNIFGDKVIPDFEIDSDDECLKYGRFKAKISRMGDITRRFCEIKIAEECTDKLNQGDIIIMDGTLQCSFAGEKNKIETLYEKAIDKKIIISAMAKASALLTKSGSSLISALKRLAKSDEWYYHPIVRINDDEHKAEMFFVKLHPKAEHVFRYEIFKHNDFEIDKLICLLKNNSKDAVFLGYPYGLIEADKFARVSNNEKQYYQMIIRNSLQLEDIENLLNSHDILDNIG